MNKTMHLNNGYKTKSKHDSKIKLTSDQKLKRTVTLRPAAISLKATSWSTKPYAHISATIQQIITKFSAVVIYVK